MNRIIFLKTVPAITVLAGTTSSFPKELQPITLLKLETKEYTNVDPVLRHAVDQIPAVDRLKGQYT